MLPFELVMETIETLCHANNIAMCAIFFNGEMGCSHICYHIPDKVIKDLECQIADHRLHKNIDEIINS